MHHLVDRGGQEMLRQPRIHRLQQRHVQVLPAAPESSLEILAELPKSFEGTRQLQHPIDLAQLNQALRCSAQPGVMATVFRIAQRVGWRSPQRGSADVFIGCDV